MHYSEELELNPMTSFIYPAKLNSRPLAFLAVTFEYDLPQPKESLSRGSRTFRNNSSNGVLMFKHCITWYHKKANAVRYYPF